MFERLMLSTLEGQRAGGVFRRGFFFFTTFFGQAAEAGDVMCEALYCYCYC